MIFIRNKFFFFLILLGTLLVSRYSFAVEVKVGLVDGQVLMQESLFAQAVTGKMKSEFGERRDKLDAKNKELRVKQESLQRDKDVLGEKEIAVKQREFAKLQSELQKLEEEFEGDVNKRQEKEMRDFQQIVNKTLANLAKEEKLDLIIPQQVAMYNTGKADYTYRVLKELDKQYKESL